MAIIQENTKLKNALEDIRSNYDIDKIIIFGSHARGEESSESDIDLCILLNSRKERILEITRKIRLSLFHRLHRSFDILVYDKDNFDERRDAGASFEKTVSREGLVL